MTTTALPVVLYGSQLEPLLSAPRIPELGAGTPVFEVRDTVTGLLHDGHFAGQPIRDHDMAHACMAGLWLRFNYLDESHAISQELHNPTGSFWHAIMHRREGDFGNSKYWFRQVGRHEVIEKLAGAAAQVAQTLKLTSAGLPLEVSILTEMGNWDPFRFVDLCESTVRGRCDAVQFCRFVQFFEWEHLFLYCYTRAIDVTKILSKPDKPTD